MQTPKVSIIIPVYNVMDCLCRCIDSVLAQNMTDWELLLIDDGSSDDSGLICDGYAAKDVRVKVIHKLNEGVSSARNTGLMNTCGNWITFIDSDDFVSSDYLTDLYNETKNGNYDLIVSGHEKRCGIITQINSFEGDVVNKESFRRLFEKHHFSKGYVWAKLFKASVIYDNKLYFDTDTNYAEDAIFLYNYLLCINTVRLLPNVNYYYVVRGGSLSSSISVYEKELNNYYSNSEIADKMMALWGGDNVYKYIRPYQFLYRVILSLYDGTKSRKERIKILKWLRERKDVKYYKSTHWKEHCIWMLFYYRMWFIYDYMINKLINKK